MSFLISLLVLYLLITVVIFVINFIKKLQCTYFIKHLRKNQRNNICNKNYNYQESIIDLLTSAKVPLHNIFISSDTITNAFGIDRVCKGLLTARGNFHNRAARSWQWLIKLIKLTLKYSPSKTKAVNYFVRFILFLLETLFVYFLSYALDTMDIGHKILTYLTSVAK